MLGCVKEGSFSLTLIWKNKEDTQQLWTGSILVPPERGQVGRNRRETKPAMREQLIKTKSVG